MVAAGSDLLLKPQTIFSKEVDFFSQLLKPMIIGSQLYCIIVICWSGQGAVVGGILAL